MTKFSVQPRVWLACRAYPGDIATPIFVSEIVPLKTGAGLLRLEIIPFDFPFDGHIEKLTLKVLAHGANYMVGHTSGTDGAPRTLILEACSVAWLVRNCPAIAQELSRNGLQKTTINHALSRFFGVGQPMDRPPATPGDNQMVTGTINGLGRQVALDLQFDPSEAFLISRGCTPMSDDDKWFICRQGDRLLWHRSWTGHLIYDVALEASETGLRFASMWVNYDRGIYQAGSDHEEAITLQNLTRIVLLRQYG